MRSKPFFVNRLSFIVYGVLFIAIIITGIIWLNATPQKNQETTVSSARCLQISDECYELEVADSDEERIRGLAYRDSLAPDKGMLFVFGSTGEQCFWMKDMRFSIDIIWTNEQKRVVKLKENVSPDSTDLFCSDETKYVLEFNKGFAKEHGIKVGSTLQF